tara:strand:+ start:3218 stop:3439 length:222 start_codon:yes stop_codon:yes gene_type:complete
MKWREKEFYSIIILGIRHIVQDATPNGTFFYCGDSTGSVLIDQPDEAKTCMKCLYYRIESQRNEFINKIVKEA